MAQYSETIESDVEKHEQYCDVAKVQRKLYPKLKDVFEDLYELSRKAPRRSRNRRRQNSRNRKEKQCLPLPSLAPER